MPKLKATYPTTKMMVCMVLVGAVSLGASLMLAPLLLTAFRAGKCYSVLVIFGATGRLVYRTVSPTEYWISMLAEALGIAFGFVGGIWTPVETIRKYRARELGDSKRSA
jgi:hypothetical protein